MEYFAGGLKFNINIQEYCWNRYTDSESDSGSSTVRLQRVTRYDQLFWNAQEMKLLPAQMLYQMM